MVFCICYFKPVVSATFTYSLDLAIVKKKRKYLHRRSSNLKVKVMFKASKRAFTI